MNHFSKTKIQRRDNARNAISWFDIKKMIKLASLRNKKIALLMIAGVCLGLRYKDLVRLTKNDLLGSSFKYRAHKTSKHETREVPQALKELCKESKINISSFPLYPFQNEQRTGFISSQYVSRCIKRAAKDLGLPDEKVNKIATHSLRKTFATRLYNKLGSTEEALQIVGKYLHHSNTEETKRYIGLQDEKLTRALNDFNID